MLKKLLCLLTALAVLLMAVPSLAADDGADPLTLEELTAWAASLRDLALTAEPMNDPHDPDALTGDGYAFVYPFGTLYFSAPDLTDDTLLMGAVLYDTDAAGPAVCLRATGIGMSAADVLASFYSENPALDGSRAQAVLYMSDDLSEGGSLGMVLRDGQRIQAITYEVLEPHVPGDGFLFVTAGVVYTLTEGYVSAIRLYGLNSTRTPAEAAEVLDAAQAVSAATGYTQFPTSVIGSDLTMFGPEDMTFSGIDLNGLTPERAALVLGDMLEDIWHDNDGGYIRTVDFAGCQMIFVYDAARQDARLMLLEISEDAGFEGPRAVRVGDTLTSVLCRFRNGEGYFDGTSELLYGDGLHAPYAVAEYGTDGSAILRYAAPAADGRTVVMMVTFEQLTVSGIMIYFAD